MSDQTPDEPSKVNKRNGWYLNTPARQELVLVGSFIVLYVFCTMILKFKFNVSFWISEMNQKYTVEFKASDISQLFILNLVWPLIAWWVYRDSKKSTLRTGS